MYSGSNACTVYPMYSGSNVQQKRHCLSFLLPRRACLLPRSPFLHHLIFFADKGDKGGEGSEGDMVRLAGACRFLVQALRTREGESIGHDMGLRSHDFA